MTDALESAFIEAIAKDPDDDEARAVYADWLEERGDPRGEYLRLEIQMFRNPPRIRTLEQAIHPSWLEAVARRYDVVMDDCGPSKISVIKVTRLVTGLGLKEAKDLVEAGGPEYPKLLRENLSRAEAEQTVKEYANTGASVRSVPHARDPHTAVFGYTADVVLVGGIDPARKLEAIKLLRELTALGLKEARDAIKAVAAGARHAIARGLEPARAQALASRFAGLATVVIERSYAR
jgi:uncharacterized protein (TIGR02996 family)